MQPPKGRPFATHASGREQAVSSSSMPRLNEQRSKTVRWKQEAFTSELFLEADEDTCSFARRAPSCETATKFVFAHRALG